MKVQPTDVQRIIIQQVREQIPGAQERFTVGETLIEVNNPRMLRFMLSGDKTVTVELRRRKRLVEVTYLPGPDAYDVRIVDLDRGGLSIVADRTVEAIDYDKLGELCVSERVAV